MKAKSIKGKSPEEIRSALNESFADGFRATLAVIFLSVSQDRKAGCEIFDKKDIEIFGATTNGEFIDEETEKGSIAILLLDINKDYFRVFFEEYPQKNYHEVAKSIAEKAKEKFSTPAFLIAGSHLKTDAEAILFGLEETIGKNINTFGCMAGDDYSFTQSFVFTNGNESNIGMVCMVLNEEKIKY